MFKNIDLVKKFNELSQGTKIALIFLTAAIILAVAAGMSSNPAEISPETEEQEEYLSTFIPAGYRLVPIEILNSSALDSILGRYGYVDLYLEKQKAPFARAVRIVKSIDASGDWAALVTENLADELMAVGARFHVAIQSTKETAATEFNEPKIKRKIIYEGE